METEIIDKLFLELSQFTQAKTIRELKLEAAILGALKISSLWLPAVETREEYNNEVRALTKMYQDFCDMAKPHTPNTDPIKIPGDE